ncbi:MAG TPA: SDR family NAD(P)-dependent oxidoreductase [Actinomycetes bacterium]|nr:SDR family NAD(P)-dependent oxidoreductase [Actinomycetes bacterium]
MNTLAGRRVLITGAAGGLGPVAVPAARDAGASLVLVGRSKDRLDELASAHGDAVESTHEVDLLDAAAVDEFAATVTSEREIDVIWHLVGGWRGGTPFAEQPLEDWELLHDLLVRTTVNVARFFAATLKRSSNGRFAIISAKEAQAPTSKNAAYASAKAASEALVLALANDFKGTSATANVVVVPAILTPQMRAKDPDKDWGNFVPAEQIADTLVYVSSTAGSKMNGQRVRLYSGAPS